MKTTFKISFCYLAIALLAVSCSDDEDSTGASTSGELVATAVATYSDVTFAVYSETITRTQAMDGAIKAFINDPTEATLAAAKTAWINAREIYGQTEVYRFYDGPIDNPEDGPEGRINAWPLDESAIDYVEGNPDAGFLQDPSFALTEENLDSINESGDEGEIVVLGWHPIEFMLWGQDLSTTGPGARPASDYTTAEHAERRKEYLGLLSDILLSDLQQVRDAWAEGASYRSTFDAQADQSLNDLLQGMIVLAGFEDAGERLETALVSQDQEDEHSCFSDNTHRDFVTNILGIQNVYLGRFQSVSGAAVKDAVAERDQELADRLEAEIAAALSASESVQVPFDQEIISDNPQGRARVQAVVDALRTVEGTLQNDVFPAFGFVAEIPTE